MLLVARLFLYWTSIQLDQVKTEALLSKCARNRNRVHIFTILYRLKWFAR